MNSVLLFALALLTLSQWTYGASLSGFVKKNAMLLDEDDLASLASAEEGEQVKRGQSFIRFGRGGARGTNFMPLRGDWRMAKRADGGSDVPWLRGYMTYLQMRNAGSMEDSEMKRNGAEMEKRKTAVIRLG